MSNTHFQFKQFRVEQDACAMKVSTDACIQGAWTSIPAMANDVLDIGCGTGLLSLMLAQRNEVIQIDAVEIDAAAAVQATSNVAASPWKERIKVYEADINSFETVKQYDLIICNPPFFTNSLLGDDEARNKVRHTISFTYAHLVNVIKKCLKENGVASVLLPYSEQTKWEQLVIANGMYISKKLQIQPRNDLKANRVISIVTLKPVKAQNETLIIYNDDKSYTEDFIDLLRPYYLYL